MDKIEIKDKNHATVVAITGDIEFDDALEINETIKKTIERGKVNLVFDLQNCNYVDSSGLGTMVEALKECQKREGDLRLCHLNNDFKDVLVMTRTIKYFQIFNSVDDAVASFG